MSRADALHQFVISLSIAVLICLLLYLAVQLQEVQHQNEHIDAHYRAVEPTPQSGRVG